MKRRLLLRELCAGILFFFGLGPALQPVPIDVEADSSHGVHPGRKVLRLMEDAQTVYHISRCRHPALIRKVRG